MASFCKKCSIWTFGEDYRELADIAGEGEVAHVLCECCGVTFVDKDGLCVNPSCAECLAREKINKEIPI